MEPARINLLPGFVVRGADGSVQTIAFEVREDAITGIYMVMNPDKLRHVPMVAHNPVPSP